MKTVSKWKMAVLIWLGIYPTITLLIYLLFPYMTDWPFFLQTLALTLIAVPLMVFLTTCYTKTTKELVD